jgi:hypothetical protein
MSNVTGNVEGYDKFIGGNSRSKLFSLNYNQYQRLILGKGLDNETKTKIKKFIIESKCVTEEVGLKYNNIVFPAESFLI